MAAPQHRCRRQLLHHPRRARTPIGKHGGRIWFTFLTSHRCRDTTVGGSMRNLARQMPLVSWSLVGLLALAGSFLLSEHKRNAAAQGSSAPIDQDRGLRAQIGESTEASSSRAPDCGGCHDVVDEEQWIDR